MRRMRKTRRIRKISSYGLGLLTGNLALFLAGWPFSCAVQDSKHDNGVLFDKINYNKWSAAYCQLSSLWDPSNSTHRRMQSQILDTFEHTQNCTNCSSGVVFPNKCLDRLKVILGGLSDVYFQAFAPIASSRFRNSLVPLDLRP